MDGEPCRKKPTLREAVTELYKQKIEETKGIRVATGTLAPRNVDFEVEQINEKVQEPAVPLRAPTKYEDALTIALQDMLPAGDKDEATPDEVYKTCLLYTSPSPRD